ncbi:MAG: ATP synthase F1 subunit delta [Calditrichaeota bacterium]|nr:ATP synthase F1 subunit delta [Calditrichota bacterium]
MPSGSLVRRYGRSLFEAARELNAVEAVRADLHLLANVRIQIPEFSDVLSSPAQGLAEKRTLVERAFGERLSEITLRFLRLLLEKRRTDILHEVIRAFDKLWREQQGEVMVTVTTAVEPDSNLKEKITRHLQTQTEKRPEITWQVDASLLGGVQVRWPDRVEDSSLRWKLVELRDSLAAG